MRSSSSIFQRADSRLQSSTVGEVEVQGRNRSAAAFRQLADRQFLFSISGIDSFHRRTC
jgi:hypothetical protein